MRTDRRTDRQTYVSRLIVAFRNFVKAPKSDLSHKTLLTSATRTLPLFQATTNFDPFYPSENCGHFLKHEILVLFTSIDGKNIRT